jgi:hypothetical protein
MRPNLEAGVPATGNEVAPDVVAARLAGQIGRSYLSEVLARPSRSQPLQSDAEPHAPLSSISPIHARAVVPPTSRS